MKLLLFILCTLTAFGNIGNVMAIKGDAKVHRNNSILPAHSGMQINEGDKLVTQNQTRAQVILKDDTIITIGSNSSFVFENFFFDGTKKSTLSLKTNRGFFRAVTGKIGEIAPERFKVKTSSATIGIRGTDFSVQLLNTIERFRCYSGGIRISFGKTHRDIVAGEVFELDIDTLKRWNEQVNKISIDSLDIPDLKDIEDASREVLRPGPPTPIIPDGIPCQTTL